MNRNLLRTLCVIVALATQRTRAEVIIIDCLSSEAFNKEFKQNLKDVISSKMIIPKVKDIHLVEGIRNEEPENEQMGKMPEINESEKYELGEESPRSQKEQLVHKIPWKINGKNFAALRISTPETISDLQKEIYLYKKLPVKKIVPQHFPHYYTCVQAEETLYLITEFIEPQVKYTQEIKNLIDDGLYVYKNLDVKQRLNIIFQIASALAEFECSGYSYHDLKQSNVLLQSVNDQIKVKLVDFSHAERLNYDGALKNCEECNDCVRSVENFGVNKEEEQMIIVEQSEEEILKNGEKYIHPDNKRALVWSFVVFIFGFENKGSDDIMIIPDDEYIENEEDIPILFEKYIKDMNDFGWMKRKGLDICNSVKSHCFYHLIEQMTRKRDQRFVTIRQVRDYLGNLQGEVVSRVVGFTVKKEDEIKEQQRNLADYITMKNPEAVKKDRDTFEINAIDNPFLRKEPEEQENFKFNSKKIHII
jgi:serine/threonine protein kinase